jgi:type IV pilus assembly protein PilM
MDLPFFKRHADRRDQILAIDLGARTTKAVHIQRRSDRLALVDYTIMDAPMYENGFSADVLTEHLKGMQRAMDNGRPRQVTVALGVNDSLFRQVEMPLLPMADLRLMLKYNSKTYLQQDLPDFVFDCYYNLSSAAKSGEVPRPGAGAKQKVMLGGARKAFIDELQLAVRNAGMQAEEVFPGIVGPVNAFELAEPEAFAQEVVALVDVGFKNSTITILDCGEIKLNRVVNIGGDRFTTGLSEGMSISYLEAENIKIGMPSEVQQSLESAVSTLARELAASITYYEHQQDKTVGQIFISGGSARGELILQALQADLIVPCKSWNPARTLQMELPPVKLSELEQAAPQLAVAVGAAAAAL